MTQDKIIRMAREAGGYFVELPNGDAWIFDDDQQLERFAALVAAHEREKQAEQEPIMRKTTRDEKIVRPGVYEVSVEQSPQKSVGIYYGEVDGIGHRVHLDVELPIGAKLYAAPVRTKDLTDDEIHQAFYSKNTGLINGIRAVIAADREKNK